MAEKTESQLFLQIISQLGGVLSAIDSDALEKKERNVLGLLRRLAVDVRLDLRDYEYAETKAEMQVNAKAALRHMEQLRKGILSASEFGVFSAVDVAQLTGQIDQIQVRLNKG
jgi:hypothetical protein